MHFYHAASPDAKYKETAIYAYKSVMKTLHYQWKFY